MMLLGDDVANSDDTARRQCCGVVMLLNAWRKCDAQRGVGNGKTMDCTIVLADGQFAWCSERRLA